MAHDVANFVLDVNGGFDLEKATHGAFDATPGLPRNEGQESQLFLPLSYLGIQDFELGPDERQFFGMGIQGSSPRIQGLGAGLEGPGSEGSTGVGRELVAPVEGEAGAPLGDVGASTHPHPPFAREEGEPPQMDLPAATREASCKDPRTGGSRSGHISQGVVYATPNKGGEGDK